MNLRTDQDSDKLNAELMFENNYNYEFQNKISISKFQNYFTHENYNKNVPEVKVNKMMNFFLKYKKKYS